MRGWGAAGLAGVLLCAPSPAGACDAWAERVVAWDFDADLVVLQTWANRDRPPPASVPPIGFELRRLSTGEELGARDCRLAPPVACELGAALAHLLPAGVKWRREGSPPPRTLRVRARASKTLRETAIETRGSGGWSRLLWLSVTAARDSERLEHALVLHDRKGEETLLGLEVHYRGGNCPRTQVLAMRVPTADLLDPRGPDRQARLMARPRLDERFEHWRTIAELGPIPPGKLIEALEAAEREDHPDFGAAWWRQNTRGLPAGEVAALTEKLKKNQALYWTRQRLGLVVTGN